MKTLSIEDMKNMSIDDMVNLYREGYILEGENSINKLDSDRNTNINDGKYISEKMSIVMPVHHIEEAVKINNTLDGIQKTIGRSDYTITIVGTLPNDFDLGKFNSPPGTTSPIMSSSIAPSIKYIKTDLMLGDAKNIGAYDAVVNYRPDILVFMDAHMNFFIDGDLNTNDWGNIISNYLSDHPDHIISPAVSLYDKPYQRGFGVISEVTDENMAYDLKWKWWGDPAKNSKNNEPFEVPGLCGCFMSMTPQTFCDTMGFTPPLAIDDREFSIRAWTLGKTFVSIPKLTIGHRFSSGYSDFTRKRSIEWGMGMLLYVYLNMDDKTLDKLYKKGIHAAQDKEEAMRLTKSNYWSNMRLMLKTKRVRTAEEYFIRFKE